MICNDVDFGSGRCAEGHLESHDNTPQLLGGTDKAAEKVDLKIHSKF